MAFQEYARLGVYYDGDPLEQITSLKKVTDGGRQRVDLLNKGLSGFTPGSGSVTIEVGYVCPAEGTEADFHNDCVTGRIVTLQIPIGRKSYIGKGIITTEDIGQSTGDAVAGSFTWLGELLPLE